MSRRCFIMHLFILSCLFCFCFLSLLSSVAVAPLICGLASRQTKLNITLQFNRQGAGLERVNLAQCHWFENQCLIIADSQEKAGILQRLAESKGKTILKKYWIRAFHALQTCSKGRGTSLSKMPHFCLFLFILLHTSLKDIQILPWHMISSPVPSKALQIHPTCHFTYGTRASSCSAMLTLHLISVYHSQPARKPQCQLSPHDQWGSLHGRNRKIHQSLISSAGDTKRGVPSARPGRFQLTAVCLQGHTHVAG